MPRPPAMSYTVDGYLPPSHLSACLVLRPICTQGRTACKLPLISGLLCCSSNSHISSYEASKHVLHFYSTPSTSAPFEAILRATHKTTSSGLIARAACPDADHAVHHAHAPSQGDHDYFEGRLPRRRPNPPFRATNSKAGLSVTELQPQTSVGHPNLPRRSDFRVLDEMQNHAACHAHAQPPHCPILGSCRSRV